MFIEFVLYTEAFVEDIKSVFGQMDHLSSHSENDGCVVDRCREIVDLLKRMNR